jgi:hypothetical protein
MLALRGVERIRFAGRAEDGETIGAFSEQPATMRGKPVAVGFDEKVWAAALA